MRHQGPHATNTIARQSTVPIFTDKQIKGMRGKFWFPVFSTLPKKADTNV